MADLVDQVRRLLRPLQVRLANLVSRGVVERTDDGKKMQMLQATALPGEVLEDIERVGQYGFASVPLAGAECVLVFPNGDRGHALCVAVDDRRYRPTGGEPGEVVVYNNAGAVIRLKADGSIEMGTSDGPYGALALKSDVDALRTAFNQHVHSGANPPTAVPPDVIPVPPMVGTAKLKAE